MDHTKYMSSSQMIEYMWLSTMRQICERVLKTTTDKAWRQRIKTCDTLISKIITERWNDMDKMEQDKAWRRIQKIGIKVYAYDDARVDREDYGRDVTIKFEDLLELADGCSLQCMACAQGDLVKDCSRRKMFHRLGLHCHKSRENPGPGECEYRYNNEQYAVTPQYRKLEKELIEELP